METVILRRVLRRAIQETEELRVSGSGISRISSALSGKVRRNRITLPRDIRVIREYALLVITSEKPHRITEYELAVPGEAVIVGAGLVLTATFEQSTGQCGDGRTGILLDAESMKLRSRSGHGGRETVFIPWVSEGQEGAGFFRLISRCPAMNGTVCPLSPREMTLSGLPGTGLTTASRSRNIRKSS